ncbi:hypothetical protein IOC57_01530 [Bacillus sp. SD075]|uniref:hypothetical protein n=1 Tax=Bacillus sp. SD075 TaxID=2781732 RepID=UPI001A96A190|nr:hypothetical protein [Bacillus sp. SD075]MBO0996446.1 hypothetical protein [Bacillus sp. SD075]
MEVPLEERGKNFFSYKDIIYCFSIAIYCSNFLDIGSYIPIIFLPYITYYIFKNRFNRVFYATSFVLLFFSIIYASMLYFYKFATLPAIIGRVYYPICFYILGDMLVKNDYHYKKTFRYFYLIIVSSTMYGFLSLIKTIWLYGDMTSAIESEGRMVINLWGNNVISATGMNAYISLGLGLLPICFLSDKYKSQKLKIVSIICFSAAVYTTLNLGNRTGLAIIILSSLMVIVFTGKIGMKKILRLILIIFYLLILYILYIQNFFGVKNAWENTLMYSRFTTSDLGDDPRFTAWKSTFMGLFENPLGGRQTNIEIGYAHNLWLDIGYDVGILPNILLMIFTLISIISVMSFITLEHPMFVKGLIIALYTSFFITFFVEPILQGLVDYFTFFCFVVGAIQRLNYDFKRLKF